MYIRKAIETHELVTSGKEEEPLSITGYTDRLSVRPGESLSFMVSSESPYKVELVRLIHGDPNPIGPGFKSQKIPSDLDDRSFSGRVQTFHHGSYVVVKNKPILRKLSSFTLQCWIYPTIIPDDKPRAIMGQWSEEENTPGYGLFIDAGGELSLWLRDRSGKTAKIKSGKALKPFVWYFVAASFDEKKSKGILVQKIVAQCRRSELDSEVEGSLEIGQMGANNSDFMIASFVEKSGSRAASFNGKIDGPKVFSKAFNAREIASLNQTPVPREFLRNLVAKWDFAGKPHSKKIRDSSKNALHGLAVNLPQRAVTGHDWSGDFDDFREAPEEYDSIYFHDDDQGDAGWKEDFKFAVPRGLKSGIYAAHLSSENKDEDYVPFFVIPSRGTSKKIAFLVPTLSYMAYANERTLQTTAARVSMKVSPVQYPKQPQDRYIVANKLTSHYDHHSDGSGVCYSSRLRPIVNMRPKYNMPAINMGKGAPHQFNADLHLVDWLEEMKYDYDVITDEDLHHEGKELIDSYKVIITGSHPEYWTLKMLEVMEEYLNEGGRFMYMGGNGFYWVTTINPESPDVFEIRRWGGTGTWKAAPGEFHNSSTGEMGGLWRNRGRHPQKLVGIGFTAQGFDMNRPYKRTEESFDPRAAFIFEGIGKDKLIGDFPSLVQEHGAAGFELDRLDYTLGTPDNTLLLASASGFSNSYQHAIEENTMSDDKQGGEINQLVRADMTFTSYPKGGGVFSVGSIAWCGSLSYNNYDNNVSRITKNVLSRFSSPEPLP